MMWMIGLEVWDLKKNISYIVLVIFISEGNRSLWRQLMTCRKSLKNYHIRLSSTSNSGIKLRTFVVIDTDASLYLCPTSF